MTIHARSAQRVLRAAVPTQPTTRAIVSDRKPARRIGIRHAWVRSLDRRAA